MDFMAQYFKDIRPLRSKVKGMRQLLMAMSWLGCSMAPALSAQDLEDARAPSIAELGAAGAQMAPRIGIQPRLRVHNRVLVTVLGKPITVLDVQKRLETQFYAQFPQYRDRPEAKHEFLQVRWRDALDELINQELILEDASERELDVPDGDVREELIRRFGADLALAMEQMNLHLDEVWEMVKVELKSQKMIGGMVFFPAFTEVTPERVKEAYDLAMKESQGKEECTYRILTVRGADSQATEAVAQRAYSLLAAQGPDTAVAVVKVIQDDTQLPPGVTCSLSEEYRQPVRNLSASHRAVLDKLRVGAFSTPVAQRSRADQQNVQRIFVLTGRDSKAPPAFELAAQGIQERLAQKRAETLHDQYMQDLRVRYGLTSEYMAQVIPADFKPFELL
jgi:hypothetical protein